MLGGICYNKSDAVKNKLLGIFSNFKLIYIHLFIKIIFEKEIICIRAYLNCNFIFFFFFLEIVIRAQHGANFDFKHAY